MTDTKHAEAVERLRDEIAVDEHLDGVWLSHSDALLILAALNTRPDVEAWQPIDSVPNDGSWGVVGCWVVDDLGEQAAWWSAWTAPFDGTSLGVDGTWGDPPTHWCRYPGTASIPVPTSGEGGAS